jgi:hypothetical protein
VKGWPTATRCQSPRQEPEPAVWRVPQHRCSCPRWVVSSAGTSSSATSSREMRTVGAGSASGRFQRAQSRMS